MSAISKARRFVAAVVPWFVPATITIAIVIWGAFLLLVIGDKPRRWSYGVLPYVPSESFYSTERPVGKVAPKQFEMPPTLPEVSR